MLFLRVMAKVCLAAGVIARLMSTGEYQNIRLTRLLADQSARELDFRFTALEALSVDMPKRGVIQRESYWKVALGSRAFGLNLN